MVELSNEKAREMRAFHQPIIFLPSGFQSIDNTDNDNRAGSGIEQ